MPAETNAFGEFSARADPRPGPKAPLVPVRSSSIDAASVRSGKKKKKVTGRCLIVSRDNLVLLLLFALTRLLRSRSFPLLSFPSRARCTTTPTTGSALQKEGTCAGGTPTNARRAAPQRRRSREQEPDHALQINRSQVRKSIHSSLQMIFEIFTA